MIVEAVSLSFAKESFTFVTFTSESSASTLKPRTFSDVPVVTSSSTSEEYEVTEAEPAPPLRVDGVVFTVVDTIEAYLACDTGPK